MRLARHTELNTFKLQGITIAMPQVNVLQLGIAKSTHNFSVRSHKSSGAFDDVLEVTRGIATSQLQHDAVVQFSLPRTTPRDA